MSRFSKFIYVALFTVLLVQPHLITGHVLSLPPAYAQSLVTILVFLTAWLVYLSHQRDIERREQEKIRLQEGLRQLDRTLLEYAKYLGTVNRRLPLLQNLTTDLLERLTFTRRGKRQLFEQLLAIAVVSVAKSPAGLLRFLEVSPLRTLGEFSYPPSPVAPLAVGNRELLSVFGQGNGAQVVGAATVVAGSNHGAPVRCFLVISEPRAFDQELGVLQAIVDQAQLFYSYLYR